MLAALTVFGSMTLIHYLWTKWATYVQELRPIHAGMSTAAIDLLAAYVIIEYVQQPSLVIASVVGSFIGAAVPVWLKARSKKIKKEGPNVL